MRKIPLARPLHFSDMVTVLNIDSLWLNASGLPRSPVTLIQLSGRIDHHAEPETMSGALHSLILQCFTKQQILSFFKELFFYYNNTIILPDVGALCAIALYLSCGTFSGIYCSSKNSMPTRILSEPIPVLPISTL